MTSKQFERTILGYSMGGYHFPDIGKYFLTTNIKTVNIHVVNSKFNELYCETGVEDSQWKETYSELYNRYKNTPDRFSRYIIVSDANDSTVLYCSKIKQS